MNEREFLRRVAEVIIGSGQEPNWDWLDTQVAEARKRGLFDEPALSTSKELASVTVVPSSEMASLYRKIGRLTGDLDAAKALLREMAGHFERACAPTNLMLQDAFQWARQSEDIITRAKEMTND